MEKGIIICDANAVLLGKDRGYMVRDGISDEQLRYYLLYWDKITILDSDIYKYPIVESELPVKLRYPITPEYEQLKKAFILNKYTATLSMDKRFDGLTLDDIDDFSGRNIVEIHLELLARLASKIISKNPGKWAIHQGEEIAVVPDKMSKDFLTVDLTLHNCLPVPDSKIPLDKLLDFKMRRNDELIALRVCLDELYLEITKSSDIPRSKIMHVEKLEKAIKDLNSVSRESWGQRIMASRKISLDITPASFLLTAGVVGESFNNPLLGLAAATTYTLASSLKFKVNLSRQLDDVKGLQADLLYLNYINQEGIASYRN